VAAVPKVPPQKLKEEEEITIDVFIKENERVKMYLDLR
jgi:hypothetical protein